MMMMMMMTIVINDDNSDAIIIIIITIIIIIIMYMYTSPRCATGECWTHKACNVIYQYMIYYTILYIYYTVLIHDNTIRTMMI